MLKSIKGLSDTEIKSLMPFRVGTNSTVAVDICLLCDRKIKPLRLCDCFRVVDWRNNLALIAPSGIRRFYELRGDVFLVSPKRNRIVIRYRSLDHLLEELRRLEKIAELGTFTWQAKKVEKEGLLWSYYLALPFRLFNDRIRITMTERFRKLNS